jgi:hypothetical protein
MRFSLAVVRGAEVSGLARCTALLHQWGLATQNMSTVWKRISLTQEAGTMFRVSFVGYLTALSVTILSRVSVTIDGVWIDDPIYSSLL